jgi:hypothetical protein
MEDATTHKSMDNTTRLLMGMPPVVNYGVFTDPDLLPELHLHRVAQTAVPRTRNPMLSKSLPMMSERKRHGFGGAASAKETVAILTSPRHVASTMSRRSDELLSSALPSLRRAVAMIAVTETAPTPEPPSVSRRKRDSKHKKVCRHDSLGLAAERVRVSS